MGRFAIVASLAVLTLWGSYVPAAGAKSKSDLVVTAVENPPALVYAGDDLPVEVTIRNKGAKKAKASKVGLGLGGGSASDPPSVDLGSLDVPALKGKKKKTVTGAVEVGAGEEAGGPFNLIACADSATSVKESKEDNNCRASSGATELSPPLSIYDKIDAEYGSGAITLGEALTFKLYAEAGDERLPPRFGTPPEDPFDSGDVVKQAAGNFASLPAADQLAIEPFFRPPIYEGTATPGARAKSAKRGAAPPCAAGGEAPQLNPNWASLETTHFRIHYYTVKPYDAAPTPERSLEVASQLAAVAENVYMKVVPVFRTPLSDAGVPCNGGDAKIDVYSARMRPGKIAQVLPYLPGADARPGWMFVNPALAGSATDVRDIFAHEFAHITQLAYDYAIDPSGVLNIEYGWIEEATATWAINHVYPEDDYEKRFLPSYFNLGAWHVPLGEAVDIKDDNGYRDYLFFLFLTKKANSTAPITSTFNATETLGSIPALNQGLGGQFATKWKDFALELMNREDRDGFQTWDGITQRLPMGSAVDFGDQHLSLDLGGQQTRDVSLPQADNQPTSYDPSVAVFPKAFAYTSFALPDTGVRQLEFSGYGYRPGSGADATTRITAWYKLANGTRHEADWSSGSEQTFCREKPDENITELVLFYTHGRPTPFLEAGGSVERPTTQGKVELKDACPIVGFDGTFQGTSHRGSPSALTDFTTVFNGNMHLSVFEGQFASGNEYELDGGVLNVTSIDGTIGGCTMTGGPKSFPLPVAGEEPNGQTPLSRIIRYPQGWRVSALWPLGNPPPTIPITRSGGPDCDGTTNDPLLAYGQWLAHNPEFMQLDPEDGTLSATVNLGDAQDPDWDHQLTFTFTPEYEE